MYLLSLKETDNCLRGIYIRASLLTSRLLNKSILSLLPCTKWSMAQGLRPLLQMTCVYVHEKMINSQIFTS